MWDLEKENQSKPFSWSEDEIKKQDEVLEKIHSGKIKTKTYSSVKEFINSL